MCITEHLSTLKLICRLLAHSTSLLISSCSFIISSLFLALWQSFLSSANLDILLTKLISGSFLCIRNISGPNTLSFGSVGWCTIGLVGDDQLTSFGSIWLHHLESHVHWLLALVFHVVPCHMLFECPDREDLPLFCCKVAVSMISSQKSSNRAGLSSSYVCFGSHVESHRSGCSFPSVRLVSP